MPIRITCPNCQKTISAPDSFAGRTGRCPGCKNPIIVPKLAPPDDEDDLFKLADDPAPEPPTAQPPSVASRPLAAAVPSSSSDQPVGPRRMPLHATSAARAEAFPPNSQRHSRRYLLFFLAMLPLGLILAADDEAFDKRFESSVENHPESLEKIERLARTARDKSPTKKELLDTLPDKRLDGAHLQFNSLAHWGYGFCSAALFAGLIWGLFPRGTASAGQTALVALGTATFGIFFLLALQGIAYLTDGFIVHGGGVIFIIFMSLKFISFSYHSALDPDNGFLLSFFGFTFGVGMCEEFCKTYPLVFRFGFKPPLDWRGACFWGLASGAGFGVAEGIMYSSSYYNGVSTSGIYLVRFTACVALHATWSASSAIAVWRHRDFFASQWEWGDMLGRLLWVLAVPMTLHGLYDTLLKKDMIPVAMLVAVASCVWLAALIEMTNSEASKTEFDFARRTH